jgi:hypothetical protein
MLKKPNFKGKTVICIASGPSLTESDCNLARLSGLPAIVTNTTFKLCPWADVLFAYDSKWWTHYIEEVEKVFNGHLLTYSHAVKNLGVHCVADVHWFKNFQHSGACAIGLAIEFGAKEILLLGYDCKISEKTHWHGDHPDGWSNCASISRWHLHYEEVNKFALRKNARVLNATRDTSLTCFEKVKLEEFLKG